MGEGAAEGLDAAQRRELARLQGRAYGPDAAGPLDPVAAARLAELEAAALGATGSVGSSAELPSAAGSLPPGPDRSARPARTAALPGGTGPAPARPDRDRGIRSPRRHAIAVAVVAVVGLVLAGAAATRTAIEAAPVVVTRLAAEPGAAGFLVGGAAYPPPQFPIAEDMQWSAPLGTVLGWEVWVGRSRSNFACLAVVRSQTVRADCVAASDFDASGVTIYLPPSAVAADLRPVELAGQAAAAYRWSPDRSVTVQVER